ncbi:helix-turn-helix domain-containing protein [Luteibacter yeojuensis]
MQSIAGEKAIMAKITQRCRIENVFGVRGVRSFLTYSRSGQPLTFAEVALVSEEGGSGQSTSIDDAYLIVTNVGAPFRMCIDRGGQSLLDELVPPGHTIVIDLAEPFDVSWSCPLNAVAAYLPRQAIFEGRKGLETHSVKVDAVLDDDLLGAIMACLRHAAGPANPREFDMFNRQLLAAVCSCLARVHSTPMDEPRLLNAGLPEEQLRSALGYILQNLDVPVSMHEVAALCGLSYRYFCRAFKASMGASPHDWAMATRVDRAKRLMQDPSLRLSDIALAVGFCDQSHFNRVFTRFSACTPGEWRRNNHDATRSSRSSEPA